MEFIILTIIFCFYVLYNEIHKRKIKNEKKEFKIPKEFYENLKDTINYIDYSIELIKQKQENINKVYIKLIDLKKDLEDKQNAKKRTKKSINNTKIEQTDIPTNVNNDPDEHQVNSSFLNRVLEDLEEDKIDFSFQKEKSIPSAAYLNSNSKQNKTIIQQLGSFFRKTFNLPEISITMNSDIPSIKELDSKQMPITIEEFEQNISKESPTPVKENTNPKQVLIQESRKIFLELKTQEEKIKFIHKLFDLGFTEDEIHLITEIPNAEILLISKLKQKKDK